MCVFCLCFVGSVLGAGFVLPNMKSSRTHPAVSQQSSQSHQLPFFEPSPRPSGRILNSTETWVHHMIMIEFLPCTDEYQLDRRCADSTLAMCNTAWIDCCSPKVGDAGLPRILAPAVELLASFMHNDAQLLQIVEPAKMAHEAPPRRGACVYDSGRGRQLIVDEILDLFEISKDGDTVSKRGDVISHFTLRAEITHEFRLHFEPVALPIEQLGVVGDASECPSVVAKGQRAGIVVWMQCDECIGALFTIVAEVIGIG